VLVVEMLVLVVVVQRLLLCVGRRDDRRREGRAKQRVDDLGRGLVHLAALSPRHEVVFLLEKVKAHQEELLLQKLGTTLGLRVGSPGPTRNINK